MSDLRSRCRTFLLKDLHDGNAIDSLVEFVVSEIGRSKEASLEQTLPLCLYFKTNEDRDEFIALVQEAKPDMVMRKV